MNTKISVHENFQNLLVQNSNLANLTGFTANCSIYKPNLKICPKRS